MKQPKNIKQSKSVAKLIPYKVSITLLFEAVYGLHVMAKNMYSGGGFPLVTYN